MDGPLRIRRIRQTRRWRWRCASCLFQFAVRQPQRPETGGHLRRVRGDEQRPPAANVRISSSTRACVSSSRCAGLVQQDQSGIAQEQPRQRHALRLPAGQALPASAQHGIQAQRLTLGEFQDSRAPCGSRAARPRPADNRGGCSGRWWPSTAASGRSARSGQPRPRPNPPAAGRRSTSRPRRPQARDRLDQRGLADAARPHQRDVFAGRQRKRRAVEHRRGTAGRHQAQAARAH